MSLINEALKKAQRQRHDDPSAPVPPVPGGGTIARRGQPRSAKSLVLISAGAVVLVVLSVVFTVYLVNRPAPSPPKVATAKPAAPKAEPPPKPIVVPPIATGGAAPASATASTPAITPPPVATRAPKDEGSRPAATPAPVPAAIETKPPPVAAPSIADRPALAPAQPPPAVVPSTPAPSSIPAQANSTPDPRIHAFVDTLRISGVKAGGAESRVLMNDRVYRLNDIVERTLGVRLIKVESNSLTFSDANGVTYVKFF